MSETPKPYLHLVHTDTDEEDTDETAAAGAAGAASAASASGRQALDDAADDAAATALIAAPVAADLPPLNQPLQQAIMHAAVGWVELCVERACYSVDIQPVAQRVYEVSVHYTDVETGGEASGEGIILRVALAIEAGLTLHTSVEPVRP